jgi:hypothetical protein
MKKKIDRAIEESKRLAEVGKDKVVPPKCLCKLRNAGPDIKSSVAKCPAHGNDRAAWRHM